MSETSLSLLNVFEVEHEGSIRHLLCFIDPVLAGARGIDSRSILGALTPRPDGALDPSALQINPEFIEAFQHFMNEHAVRSPELAQEARNHPGDWLYVIDSRHEGDPQADPPASEVVGCFAVDETGQIVPNSFQYNRQHLWFSPDTGGSSLLMNRHFYDWLHVQTEP
jgi:hypothetical protein